MAARWRRRGGRQGYEMLGRVGAGFVAGVLSLGVAAGPVEKRADVLGGDAVPRRMAGGAPTAAGAEDTHRASQPRAPRGECELARADRARTPSSRCVACHDGTIGPGIVFYMGARGTAMSHPVEMDYEPIAARQPDRYEAGLTLPREVPLVDGKVACTSCHDGASPDPKHVVIPTRLCQSCHRF